MAILLFKKQQKNGELLLDKYKFYVKKIALLGQLD